MAVFKISVGVEIGLSLFVSRLPLRKDPLNVDLRPKSKNLF
jgi:hypothetical protein